MKIGGTARFFAEVKTREDMEEAWKVSQGKKLPLIVLGAGTNTVFADGTIEALVVHITADKVVIQEPVIRVEAGKTLATLINELAQKNLDLSALAGIPGTLGGAIAGNAGQGAEGVWTDSFISTVTVFGGGTWRTLAKGECGFAYRESIFKHCPAESVPVIWEATLTVPSKPAPEVQAEIERIWREKTAAQPYRRTAGSCFTAIDGTPAWKLIDAAGLRGKRIGGVEISEKHANFLINADHGSFEDLVTLIKTVRAEVPQLRGIEMRLIGEDGKIVQL